MCRLRERSWPLFGSFVKNSVSVIDVGPVKTKQGGILVFRRNSVQKNYTVRTNDNEMLVVVVIDSVMASVDHIRILPVKILVSNVCIRFATVQILQRIGIREHSYKNPTGFSAISLNK